MKMDLQFIADYCSQHGLSVSCAESCTGGLLAGQFTALAGSSAWFNMSWVTYSNEAKQRLLGVSAEVLQTFGAVSEQTVRQMAQGALQAAQADFAVSISGIAGPAGGSETKPVGTVWFGLASKYDTEASCQLFSGNRDEVRQQAVAFALQFLANHIRLSVA